MATTDWYQWSQKNAPPTPYWLPQFVPGLTAGQTMQQLPTKIPSGQLWSRTPWSQRMGLQSYVNWAAGTPGSIAAYQDLVERLFGMLPRRAPSGAASWARQVW